MSDKKYLVIIEDGDRLEKVFCTSAEANREAVYQWNHLTDREKQRTNIYAVEVQREWLDDDAVDDESGEIDWRMFTRADAFPGSFDSDDAERLLAAAKRWEHEGTDDLPRSIHVDRLGFDLGRSCWTLAASLDYAPVELTLSADGFAVESK